MGGDPVPSPAGMGGIQADIPPRAPISPHLGQREWQVMTRATAALFVLLVLPAVGCVDLALRNCDIARQLFQNQPGVTVRYWCERGRFNE